jgi:septum formation protein
LLTDLGVEFDIQPVDLDEAAHPAEQPDKYVQRLARDKACAAAALLENDIGDAVVLGADTAVVLDGYILGKPSDRFDGLAMLARLAGREHQVMTAIAFWQRDEIREDISITTVKFRTLIREECEAYWRTGEPLDKAGGYAIQGKGAAFIESIAGSYSGVVGLPLFETCHCLRELGVLTDLDREMGAGERRCE